MKTSVNTLLTLLIHLVREQARHYDKLDPDWHYLDEYRELDRHVPLSPQNVKRWLDAMWKLLLMQIPEPEKHPRLRQLGNFPSRRKKGMNLFGSVGAKTQAANIRATIKAKLGLYLERMLNEQTAHK